MATSQESRQPSPLAGISPTAVVDILRERRARFRAGVPVPSCRTPLDGRVVALVVEGGSMRGVCSAAGMVALAHLGYSDLFDRIYATSAAVFNASYFLSHQSDLGISVYFESLLTTKFFNPLRFWKMLDIDWLFDVVITQEKPLDVERVQSSTTRLLVALMDQNGFPHIVDVQASPEPLLTLLKAAVAAPVFYNRCVKVDDRDCIDGGLIHPFALEPALFDGCTDILILTTRPHGISKKGPRWSSQMIFNLISARSNRRSRRAFAESARRYDQLMNIALGRTPGAFTANIAVLSPGEASISAWSGPKLATLRIEADKYYRAIQTVFGDGEAHGLTTYG